MVKYLLPIARVYAYCLMPNHFHIILEIKSYDELPEEYTKGNKKLHQPFSNLFNSYSKSINKQYGRSGSLFQEHMGRQIISDEDYLRDVILYVHLNPIKHGFTNNLEEFLYSSYKSFFSSSQTNLMRYWIIDLFGGKDNFVFCHQRQLYKKIERLNDIENEDCD